MKLWSVQKKEVVYYVSRDGVFQPDFSKSEYLNGIPNLQPLSSEILQQRGVGAEGQVLGRYRGSGNAAQMVVDCSKSEYLNGIPNLQPLYYFLLEVFNRRSRLDVEVPGLILMSIRMGSKVWSRFS